MIHSSGNAEITCVGSIVVSHTIPSTVIGLNPFVFNELSVYGIVCLAVHREQPRAYIDIIAVRAHKTSVGDCVVVSGRGDCRTPIDDGIADLAEGPVGVSCLGAGDSLVGKCLGSMYMTAVPRIVICLAFCGGNHILRHLVHFGINLRTFTGECICCTVNKRYKTAVDLHADVDGPEFLHALELSIGICRAAFLRSAFVCVAHFELPCADRKRSKNALAGLIVYTGADNGDRCDVFVVLN